MIHFLVFAWKDYYPSGGMNDLVAKVDKLEDAKQAIIDHRDPDGDEIGFCGAEAEVWKFVDTEGSELIERYRRKSTDHEWEIE